jgi:hypothetical protein
MALSREQCSAIVDSCISQVLSLIASDDGWTELSPEDGVLRSQRSFSDGRQIVRGIGIFDFPPTEIKDFLLDIPNKKLLDDRLEEGFILLQFDSTLMVIYERYAAPWPVSPRDFVYAQKVMEREDGIFIVAKSVEMGVPEREGVVRGEVIASGFYLRKVEERKTEVSYLACADPKGLLPGFVVDMFAQKQTSSVVRIREAMNAKIGRKD